MRCLVSSLCALTISGSAIAQMEFSLPPGQTSFTPVRIGEERGRLIQVLKARSREPAPIVIMLDDWPKPGRKNSERVIGLSDMLRARGIAFALIPADRFGKDEAKEVAPAVDALKARASDLGVDMSRIAVLGEGLGASYAAAIALNPEQASRLGLNYETIRAAVLLDGECYDVKRCIATASPRARGYYLRQLPEDEDGQAALSPLGYAAAPNVRSIYVHFAPRSAARSQSEALVEALRSAGQAPTLSSATLRFDQHGQADTLDRERPNPSSGTMLDYLATQLGTK